MILVLTGMHTVAFDRLVQAADRLAAKIDEAVIIQCGSSTFRPRFADSFDFTSAGQIEALVRQARVVVSHAGAGSILLALRLEKPVVIVPRAREFGRDLDDHQQQLARALARQYRLPVVHELSAAGLLRGIQRAGQVQVRVGGNASLVRALKEQLACWERAKS